jgi:hypothetical protein
MTVGYSPAVGGGPGYGAGGIAWDTTGTTITTPSGGSVAIPSGTYTWATRPAANSVPSGTIITITDIAAQPHQRISDGTYWRPMGIVPLLSQLTQVTKTDADTNYQQVWSYTIPAGSFCPPGTSIHIQGFYGANVVGGVTKTMQFLLGGIGTGDYTIDGASLQNRYYQIINLVNPGWESWWPGNSPQFGQGGAQSATNSMDMSISRTLLAQMKWNTAGAGTNTLTANSVKVWLVP